MRNSISLHHSAHGEGENDGSEENDLLAGEFHCNPAFLAA
jgi:hypothetical protein